MFKLSLKGIDNVIRSNTFVMLNLAKKSKEFTQELSEKILDTSYLYVPQDTNTLIQSGEVYKTVKGFFGVRYTATHKQRVQTMYDSKRFGEIRSFYPTVLNEDNSINWSNVPSGSYAVTVELDETVRHRIGRAYYLSTAADIILNGKPYVDIKYGTKTIKVPLIFEGGIDVKRIIYENYKDDVAHEKARLQQKREQAALERKAARKEAIIEKFEQGEYVRYEQLQRVVSKDQRGVSGRAEKQRMRHIEERREKRYDTYYASDKAKAIEARRREEAKQRAAGNIKRGRPKQKTTIGAYTPVSKDRRFTSKYGPTEQQQKRLSRLSRGKSLWSKAKSLELRLRHKKLHGAAAKTSRQYITKLRQDKDYIYYVKMRAVTMGGYRKK